MSGAEVPTSTVAAVPSSAAIATTKKTVREKNGSSPGSVGISRQRQARAPKPITIAPARFATSHPVIPRSTNEWTEKSASTPERVRNVP